MPDSLHAKLSAARRRWRLLNALTGTAVGFTALTALVFASFYSDRVLVLGSSGRLAWLVALLGSAVLSAALIFARSVLKPITDEAVAARVEQRYPVLGERLLTTIELAHAGAGGASSQMVAALTRDTEAAASGISFPRAIPASDAGRPMALACVAAFLLLGHVTLAPHAMRVWLNRLLHPDADIPVFARTQVYVTPDTVVPRGEPAAIAVKVMGRVQDRATLFYRQEGAGWTIAELSKPQVIGAPDGEVRKFQFQVPEAEQSLTYYATSGDGRSNPHTLRVEDRPTILSVRTHFTYPAYTHHPPETITATAGNIVAPVGTRVELLATANKPLKRATLVENGKPRGPWMVEGDTVRGKMVVARDETYCLNLVDQNGFTGQAPPQYTVRAQPDRPPEVQIVRPAADVDRTPNGSLTLQVRATDDYGVESLWVEHRVGTRTGEFGLPGQMGAPQVSSTGVWSLASLGLKPGDTVVYDAVARDGDTVSGPHSAKSAAYRIHILGVTEMRERLEAQQAQEREALKQLLERQKAAQAQLETARRAGKPETVGAAESAQRGVAQEALDLARQMQQTSEQMHDNQIGTAQEQRHREATEQSLQQLGQKAMPAAADTIQRAAQQPSSRSGQLSQAARQEEAINQELSRLAQETERPMTAGELAQRAEDLAQEQQQLADQSDVAADQMGSKSPAQMTSQERSRMAALAKRQAELRAHTEALRQQIQRSAQDAQEHGKQEASALRSAAQQMSQSGVQQKQSGAQQNLQSGSPSQASQQQNQAAQDLRNLSQSLDQAVQPTDSRDLERRAQRLEAAADRLNALFNKQRLVHQQTQLNPDADRQKLLAQKEKEIKQQVQQLSQQFADSPSAGQSLQRAEQSLDQATSQLNQAHSRSALDPERQAAIEMLRASREAYNAARDMRDQQAARELQQQVQQLAREQRATRQQTEQLAAAARHGQLTPQQQKAAQDLANRQQSLLDKTRQLSNDMPSQAFQWAAGEAAKRMESAQRGLSQRNMGADTQRHQEHAEQTLERIARSLGQQSQGSEQSRTGSGGASGGEQAMADASGELQLSREMQEQIRQETGSLDKQRERNPRHSLTAEQQRELNDLQQAQRETREIAQNAARQLRASPDISSAVQKAADEMADVQDMLQQGDTGNSTQSKQERIVGMLDRALEQTRQAMRQQRERMAQQRQSGQQQQQQASSQQTPGGNQPAPRTYAPIVQAHTGSRNPFDTHGRGFGALSPRAQQSLREGEQERVPAEYRELVNQYYKALSERGNR